MNVLSESQDVVAKSFAGMLGKDMDRFSVGHWHTLKTGSPALQDAAAIFDCTVAETIDQFSHTIFLGNVLAAWSGTGTDTLLYGAKRFRTLRKVMAAPNEAEVESLYF